MTNKNFDECSFDVFPIRLQPVAMPLRYCHQEEFYEGSGFVDILSLQMRHGYDLFSVDLHNSRGEKVRPNKDTTASGHSSETTSRTFSKWYSRDGQLEMALEKCHCLEAWEEAFVR